MSANGRNMGRIDSSKSWCQGCQVRIAFGDPVATDTWAQQLHLTPAQVNLLLEGAAEFDELAGLLRRSAVEFVDWMSVDALRDGKLLVPDYDGAPNRNVGGEMSDRRDAEHRHPDPIPYMDLGRLGK